MTDVQGHCDDRFAPVQAAFADGFARGEEHGASVFVTLDGRPVVDIWAGVADDDGTSWQRDTLVNVYSTTKTMAALCVLMLADRGEVDLHAPVATYWPEFAANGKEGVLVSHVMSHTAGVSGFDPAIAPTALYDWDAVCAGLAAQAPWWEPGTASGYHAITQGYLQGEIVRRVTGRSIGTFFREEVAEPLGADFHIGLPASEDGRVADLVPPPAAGLDALAAAMASDSIAVRTLLSCPIDATEPRTRAWRGAEIPAAGGTGNARSVGRVHSALACGGEIDGVRLLSEAGVERILEEQSHTDDLVLGLKVRFGMGFGLMNESIPLSQSPRSFFWGGYGGSLALTDLDRRMTVTYVMNKMSTGLAGDLRGASIVFAAYGALDALAA
ncbi:MAG TPA: serine hydrolase domain-containing protein [Iamia sp.]|jgi:CubicO group peptidase (beta-lactamase class C family)|nr:serine hydrolase domain-containing protein [Iamia sp.]